jgi:hypothetical protein
MISVLLAATTSTTVQNPAAEAITSLTNLDEACGVDKSGVPVGLRLTGSTPGPGSPTGCWPSR